MSDKQTSTLQSYIDSATGAAQSVVGSITGSNADKVGHLPEPLSTILYHTPTHSLTLPFQSQAEQKKAEADAKKDLSHAGGSIGPVDVSASGVAPKSSDRTDGSWNQTVGAGKETLGGLIGAQGLKQEGIRQNQEGKAQEAQGQVKDLGQGIGDRVTGTVGGAVAGLTGNQEAKASYERQHDAGKTSQRGVEAELQKQAEAESK